MTELVLKYVVFLLLPLLFVTVGVLGLINNIWGLLSGGPRAQTRPGAPFLYDRVYYLLSLINYLGWSGFAIGFFGSLAAGSVSGIFEPVLMITWAVGAIGAGLQGIFRSTMMLRAEDYLAQHGFILLRISHKWNAHQQARGGKYFMPLLGGVFVVAGISILIANYRSLPLVLPALQADIFALLKCIPGV